MRAGQKDCELCEIVWQGALIIVGGKEVVWRKTVFVEGGVIGRQTAER